MKLNKNVMTDLDIITYINILFSIGMFCINPTLPLKTPELSVTQEKIKDQITRPVVI